MSSASSLVRPRVEALDAILGKPLRVLDDGFVRVVDYMGSDEAIVQAARVSYGEGTKKVHEDRGLIRYLMRHRHTTPFEMCEIKLHVRVPMDCWRQWIRHRTASVNEYSTRYSVAIDGSQRTPADGWRLQQADNKQGSGDFIDPEVGRRLTEAESELQARARSVYAERLERGVAREQARKDLPLSTYTEAYWKIDLHNLLHFLELRMDAHAQREIRDYATLIGHEIVQVWVPHTWEAFLDYHMSSMALSRTEAAVVAALARGARAEALQVLRKSGMLGSDPAVVKLTREGRELEAKLARLGFELPS